MQQMTLELRRGECAAVSTTRVGCRAVSRFSCQLGDHMSAVQRGLALMGTAVEVPTDIDIRRTRLVKS